MRGSADVLRVGVRLHPIEIGVRPGERQDLAVVLVRLVAIAEHRRSHDGPGVRVAEDAAVLLGPRHEGRGAADARIEAVVWRPHTVSYTHLRAHETRHDLVCRLLLEKKKI